MYKGNLFGSSATKSKNLVEFKAGKMTIDDKNWVHPDKRKGLVYIHQNDGLTHFCWKDRLSGNVEDDLIVFPDDTEFKRIEECKTGRVYVLKFKNSKKFFLWLQEPKADKDEEICKKVNDSLNSAFSNQEKGLGSKDILSSELPLSKNDIISILGMDRDTGNDSEGSSRVSSVAGRATSARREQNQDDVVPVAESGEATAPGASSPNGNNGLAGNSRFKITDLRAIFKNIQQTSDRPLRVELTDVLNSDSILPLLNNPEYVSRLVPLLPTNEISDDIMHIKDNVQCPQMHTAIKIFGNAIQSGELAPVLSQFNLGDNVNLSARTGSLKELSKALETNLKVSSFTKSDVEMTSKKEESTDQGDEPMDQD